MLAAAVLAGCGGGDRAADVLAVEQAVRNSVEAENAGDVGRFLDLWTDAGLLSYDAGSRADLEAGRGLLGTEHTEVRAFVRTDVEGDRAAATLDARVEVGLYRMRYDLVRQDGRWLLDGFRFMGPTPPAEGMPVVDVRAVEYAYEVDPTALRGGDMALRFFGAGREQHELSLFALPEGPSRVDAVVALTTAAGTNLSVLPDGYRFLGHLAFASPGDGLVYTLADPLPPGRYAMACFLPVGGLGPAGTPNQPGAEPHVARGMLADFTVG